MKLTAPLVVKLALAETPFVFQDWVADMPTPADQVVLAKEMRLELLALVPVD